MCVFASTLCKYELKKGDLFVLSWDRVCLRSASALVFIGGGCVCSILFVCHFARCSATMVVCIVVRLVFMSCSVMVSLFVSMFVVYLMLLNLA